MFQSLIAMLTALFIAMGLPMAQTMPITEVTGLGEFLSGVTDECPIVEIYFTEGYGFSTAEMTTTDSEEIAAVINALTAVQVGRPSGMDVTDWYPCLALKRADGMCFTLRFDGRWLSIGYDNYELSEDDGLWTLLKTLIRQQEEARWAE